MYSCQFCKLAYSTERLLHIHLKEIHSSDDNFYFSCGIQGCPNTFVTLPALHSHRSRKHQMFSEPKVHSSSYMEIEDNDESDSNVSYNIEMETTENYGECDRKKKLGKFILNLRATSNISASGLQKVLIHMKELVEQEVERAVLKMKDLLKNQNLSVDVIDEREIINDSVSQFNDFQTTYIQDKYFSENFNVIKPISVDLSRKIVPDYSKSNTHLKIEDLTMIYVPLPQIIINTFQNPVMKNIILEEKNSLETSTLRSFNDGSLFKSCKFFRDNPRALQLILYYDELEVCNPLGSRAGIQKLGMFYVLLGNIPERYRSMLKMINLVIVAKADIVKSHGMDEILKPLINDFKAFEKGIRFPNGSVIHGRLVALTGDNLGVHGVAGFKEGFTAQHCCRYCMASITQVRECTEELKDLLRNNEMHNSQVEELNNANETERLQLSKDFGVNRGSLLTSLDYYHVIDGIPPDIMHDILEGVLPLSIRLLLKKICIEKKIISLDEFNERLAQFDYGYSEIVNKPSAIKLQHLENLNQSASQIWLLSSILPLILGTYVSDKCCLWNNFITLLEACSIIFSSCPTLEMVEYMRISIEDYLHAFQKLYSRSLIPKQHFLTHYARFISKYGTLVNFCAMRMEAKHQYFKNLVKSMRNFKNLPMTLATKHQLYQAYFLQGPVLKNIECGPATQTPLASFNFKDILEVSSPSVYVVPWIMINGIKYVSTKCYLILKCDVLPLFGHLEAIIDDCNGHIFFVCRKVKTIKREIHLCAFEIELYNEYISVESDNIAIKSVFHSHYIDKKKYIVVRQAVCDLY